MASAVTAWVDAARHCLALVSVSYSLAPTLLSSSSHSFMATLTARWTLETQRTACRMKETDGKDKAGWRPRGRSVLEAESSGRMIVQSERPADDKRQDRSTQTDGWNRVSNAACMCRYPGWEVRRVTMRNERTDERQGNVVF